MGHTNNILEDVRQQTAAEKPALDVARNRRDDVLGVASTLPGTLETYRSGSLAAGLMIRPVTDGDCGLVLDRRVFPELGPDGNGVGPMEKVRAVKRLLLSGLRDTYPNVTVEVMKRGLLIEMHEPMDEDQDPTVDLVIALNRRQDDALWIPKIDWDDESATWSPGHPKKHLQLLRGGSEDLIRVRSRIIRLGKAWKNQFDDPGICSFNIAALALEAIEFPEPLDRAMVRFFEYAAAALAIAETDDPAGVSGPIHVDDQPGRHEVVRRLERSAASMRQALAHDDDLDTVTDLMRMVFPDQVKPPSAQVRIADALRSKSSSVGLGSGLGLTTGASTQVSAPHTRAFGGPAA